MQDKDKLRKLLDFIEELLKEEGNEWLIDELLNKIEKISPLDKVAKTSVIQRINEYCIEENINKQAERFYHDFQISEIKSQLIRDFKKMEHERRRNDFENFSFAVYQQIEGVVNHLFKYYVKPKWDDKKSLYAIKNRKDKTIEEIVFNKADKWYENIKFRSVIYFFYFNEELRALPPFYHLDNTFNEIYQIRNKSHRGGVPTDFQKKILDEIKGYESRFYLKFYGFLEEFIREININMKQKEEPNTTK